MNNPRFLDGPSRPTYGAMATSTAILNSSPYPELHSLSESIATNVYTINSSLKQLDDTLKAIGTKKDSQGLRDKV